MPKQARKMKSIQDKLEKLCCPYIEDGSEQWMAELLLHPSEARSKLLTWIVCSFDPDFEDVLNNSLPVINNRIDSRHQKLLFVLNLMGLCKIDDLEFVRGTSSQRKQILLWDELTDMLYTSQTGIPYNYTGDAAGESGDDTYYLKPARAPSLSDTFQASCAFVDTLVREQKISDLFCTEIHLFPPDLEGKIKEELVNQDRPTVDTLLQTAEKINEDIKSATKQLNGELDNFTDAIAPDQCIVDNYCRKIDISLKTFTQMIDSYVQCFENDIQTWCTDKKPELSELGPAIKTVHNMLLETDRLNKAVKSMNSTASYMSGTFSQDLQVMSKRKKNIDVRSLNDTANILQESLQRRKNV